MKTQRCLQPTRQPCSSGAQRPTAEHSRSDKQATPLAEAGVLQSPELAHPTAEPLRQNAIQRLQREHGNTHVQPMVSARNAKSLLQRKAALQRDGEFQLNMPELGSSLGKAQPPLLNVPRLRLNLINRRGVARLQSNDPAPPPWLGQAQTAVPQSSEDESDDLWSLDFDMKINPQSALARSLAQQDTLEQLLSGEEAKGTPLGLRVFNTAVNVLMATPEGKKLRRRLHLEDVTITLNPAEGNYGVSATFRFP
jgi:hypothetical protein